MSKIFEALRQALKDRSGGGSASGDVRRSDGIVLYPPGRTNPHHSGAPASGASRDNLPRRTEPAQTSAHQADRTRTDGTGTRQPVRATPKESVDHAPQQQPGHSNVVRIGGPRKTEPHHAPEAPGNGSGAGAVIDVQQTSAGGNGAAGHTIARQQGFNIVVKQGSPRAEAEPAQSLDIPRVLHLVGKRRALFASVAALIITAVVIISYIIPPAYEAKTLVAIEQNLLNDITKDMAMTPAVDAKASALATMMKSRTLIAKVVSDLDLDLARTTGPELDSLIEKIQDRTEVKIEFNKAKRTDIDFFIVSYRDRDPKVAQAFVNTLVGRYIEETLKYKREESSGASTFLQNQIAQLREKINKLDEEIVALKGKEEQLELLRQKEEAAMLKRGASAGFDDRRVELGRLQRRLDGLRAVYSDNYPEVIQLKAEMAALREQIKASPRPQAAAAQAPAGEAGSAALAEASDVKTRLAALDREREVNKKIYDELAAAHGISQVTAQAQLEDRAGRFRIVDPAILPDKPVSPNRIKIMLLGILGGIAGALGLLMVLNSFDTSVRSVDALKTFGVPVIVVPHMTSREELNRKSRNNVVFYGLTCLYVLFFAAVLAREVIRVLQ